MEPGQPVALPGGEGGRLETSVHFLFHFHFPPFLCCEWHMSFKLSLTSNLLLNQFVTISGVEANWRYLCLHNHVGSSSNQKQSKKGRQVGLQLLQALWI